MSLSSSHQCPQSKLTGSPLQQRINVIFNIKHFSNFCLFMRKKKLVFSIGKFPIGPITKLKDFESLVFFIFTTWSSCLCCCALCWSDLCWSEPLNHPWEVAALSSPERSVKLCGGAMVSSLCFAGLSSFLVFSKWQICPFSVVFWRDVHCVCWYLLVGFSNSNLFPPNPMEGWEYQT